MSKQRHDPGVKKKRWQKEHQPPKPKLRLQWLRVKRRHPGPEPLCLREFSDWIDAGKPTLDFDKADRLLAEKKRKEKKWMKRPS